VAGKEYLDFAGGIAVNCLGHSDDGWQAALAAQAARLCHTSNLYLTEPGGRLARALVQHSFADRVFFANSGTEANEAALKFARKYQARGGGAPPAGARSLISRGRAAREVGGAARPPALVAAGHRVRRLLGRLPRAHLGRAVADVEGARAAARVVVTPHAAAQEGYRKPFEPLVPGCRFAKFGDLASAARLVRRGVTAAILVEPVQGEGGIRAADAQFLAGLRLLADESGALLIFDEVQCGLGRTGALWAHTASGVTPDMMTLAKPLAAGLPIGALLCTQAVAGALAPGDHGSTFAGGPLITAVAEHVLQRVAEPAFLAAVAARGEQLASGLRAATAGVPCAREVRSAGLLVGLQLDRPAAPLVEALRARGLLAITAGKGDVLRLVPPLTVSAVQVNQAVALIGDELRRL